MMAVFSPLKLHGQLSTVKLCLAISPTTSKNAGLEVVFFTNRQLTEAKPSGSCQELPLEAAVAGEGENNKRAQASSPLREQCTYVVPLKPD